MTLDELETTTGPAQNLRLLLIDGDRACARGDANLLARVARWLCPCFAAPQQMELDEIARLARTDLTAAASRWARVVGYLRARLSPTLDEGAFRV